MCVFMKEVSGVDMTSEISLAGGYVFKQKAQL